MRIKGIEKLTNSKFLNMFKILYEKINLVNIIRNSSSLSSK